jgi:hypothetical protein
MNLAHMSTVRDAVARRQDSGELPLSGSPPEINEGNGNQSRNTLAGSVRAARQAGNKQAETAVIVITASADPNIHGSCGFTL